VAVWASGYAGIDRPDIDAAGVMLLEARWKGTVLKLKLEPPPDRTAEQLEKHFEVERAIAARLMRADRRERAGIYRSMYDELFAKVPDHPRLRRRNDAAKTAAINREQLELLGRFIRPGFVVVEFGPGDCRFSFELCQHAGFVYGIDISDQSGMREGVPDNFQHIVYDGSRLPLAERSADVVYSDQLIEHLHPEDASRHFGLVREILRNGGVYVFRTPHGLTGPHDVSKYFTDRPQGFHLKEWTYTELAAVLRGAGYRTWQALYGVKGRHFSMPVWFLSLIERFLGSCPGDLARRMSRLLFRNDVCMVAYR